MYNFRSNSGISLKHTNISSQNLASDKQMTSKQPLASKLPGAGQNTGVSGIPSPRGKPPAPPVRRSSDMSSCNGRTSETGASNGHISDTVSCNGDPSAQEVPSDMNGHIKNEVGNADSASMTSSAANVTSSSASVTSSYLTRTCSLPRHKRMGK